MLDDNKKSNELKEQEKKKLLEEVDEKDAKDVKEEAHDEKIIEDDITEECEEESKSTGQEINVEDSKENPTVDKRIIFGGIGLAAILILFFIFRGMGGPSLIRSF